MRCDDGTAAGAFPRELLTSTQGRQYTSFFSVCEFDIRDASIPRYAAWFVTPTNAVARVYPAHPDGTVDCTVNILLPSAGPNRRCEDFGFRLVRLEGETPFERERCEVPQLSDAELESRVGFHSFIDPTREYWSQQLLINSTRIPIGAQTEIRCWRGNNACGFNGNFEDAGADAP